jgi:hypothetical protein
MSDDMRRTRRDARVDEQRAYEGDAERRDRVDDPVRRDQTITSDPARHDDTATAHDAMLEGEPRRDPATDVHDVGRDPSSERRGPTAGPDTSTGWGDGLLNNDDRTSYQKRWDDIQVRFIDEPRESVRQADDLVGEVTSRIADRFSNARHDMEQRWEGGNEPTTEELRQAVQRYRDFFQRLVAQ